MTGLVLKLAPRERLLINGAVIENGPRRSRFNIVTPGANILRLKDAIHPDEATTPVRRICYVAQLALSGDGDMAELAPELMIGISDLSAIFCDAESHRLLAEARAAVQQSQPYRALKSLRALLEVEEFYLKAGEG